MNAYQSWRRSERFEVKLVINTVILQAKVVFPYYAGLNMTNKISWFVSPDTFKAPLFVVNIIDDHRFLWYKSIIYRKIPTCLIIGIWLDAHMTPCHLVRVNSYSKYSTFHSSTLRHTRCCNRERILPAVLGYWWYIQHRKIAELKLSFCIM